MSARIGVVVEDVEPEFKPIGIELTIHTQEQLDNMIRMFEFASSTVVAWTSYTPVAASILNRLKNHVNERK